MINYHIYIILNKINNNSYSNFLKSLTSFFIRSKSKIISIFDFGNYFYYKKIKRLFYFKINCKKNVLIKIPKLFKNKKEIIFNFLIIKNSINNYIINFKYIKKYISKNLKILPSIIKKIKYNNHNNYSKIIKRLKFINVIPNNFIFFIKKINFFYD